MKILSVGIQNKGESISVPPKIHVSKLCFTLKVDYSEQMQYSTAQSVLQGQLGKTSTPYSNQTWATQFQTLSKVSGQMPRFQKQKIKSGLGKKMGKQSFKMLHPCIWSLLTIPQCMNNETAQCNFFVRQKNLCLFIPQGVLTIQKSLYLEHYLVSLSLYNPRKELSVNLEWVFQSQKSQRQVCNIVQILIN